PLWFELAVVFHSPFAWASIWLLIMQGDRHETDMLDTHARAQKEYQKQQNNNQEPWLITALDRRVGPLALLLMHVFIWYTRRTVIGVAVFERKTRASLAAYWMHRMYSVLAALIIVLVWKWYPLVSAGFDLYGYSTARQMVAGKLVREWAAERPMIPWLRLLTTMLVSGGIHVVWYSFISYAYHMIVWKQYLRDGLVVWVVQDGAMSGILQQSLSRTLIRASTETRIPIGSMLCTHGVTTTALCCQQTQRFQQWIDSSTGKLDTRGLEAKWKKRWTELQSAQDTKIDAMSPEEIEKLFYVLVMFPYPSGALHMGHVRVYTISDMLARFHRMQDKKVVYPMGWDAFGLPAENAAIERGVAPGKWTRDNIAAMKRQLKDILADFDWEREISTCDADYYRWTQHLFLQLMKHDMVYRAEAEVNWDPVDQTVLANEQVDAQGRSWRSGAVVEKRRLKQWFARITAYAEDLLQDLDQLQWPAHVKVMQANWIGRSEGVELKFALENDDIAVFTTRADTVFGVSYIALAYDHPLISKDRLPSDRADEVIRVAQKIVAESNSGSDMTFGAFTGLYASHPLDPDRRIPVWVASYVVPGYGTGAVMGVPAHDTRDRDFCASNGIPAADAVVADTADA
ncbi:Leucyl-tRNA synthetase, mitochondrial, partial [Coemansia erecta]